MVFIKKNNCQLIAVLIIILYLTVSVLRESRITLLQKMN